MFPKHALSGFYIQPQCERGIDVMHVEEMPVGGRIVSQGFLGLFFPPVLACEQDLGPTGIYPYTRSKVCFSDNWFKMRRWEKGLAQIQADREKAREAEAKGRASLTEWIHERHPLCRHITNRQVEDLIASKLVTPEQVRAAGLQA